MKIARYLSVGMLGLFVVTTRTSADPIVPEPVENPDNPYTQYDPDGVPLAVTHPQAERLSPEQFDAIRKQEEQAILDKNWLLRDYEKELQIRAAKSSGDQSANLYYQLSSNKELAKLAGLPAFDSDTQEGTSPVPHSNQDSLKLRAEASSAATGDFSSHRDLFKPLITPLSAPEAAGLPNFYASLPLSMISPISGGVPKTPAVPKPDQSLDSTDMETPGMVAAEKDPLMNAGAPDLTLDMLPGESIEHAKAHQDDTTKLELPLPMDVDQLHKAQAVALGVPGPANAAPTAPAAPVPVKAVPINDEDAPLPVSKEPQINPVRSPIANPYDILNR